MDDATIKARCEEIWRTALKVYEQRGVVPWGEVVIEQMAFGLRAAFADGQRAGMELAAEIACNECLCPADVAYDNALPNQTQGDSYNAACLKIFDKIRQAAGEVGHG